MREPPGPCGAGRLRVACCPDRSPAAARPARPLAVRAASFARRVGSKPGQAPQASRRPPIGRGACVLPGQAPPPPTGTAAKPCRPRGGLESVGACCLCVARPGPAAAHGCRSLAPPPPTGTAARPRRRGLAPQAPRLEARPVAAHQFRMQFPFVIVPICVSLQCYVTCVFELHATYVSYWPRCHPSVP